MINNACDASPTHTPVAVVIESNNEWHTVSISDSGKGIDQNVRDQIFEPFFTTKPVGQGTGLGLSLVYSLVTDHGGTIRIDEDYVNGTRMIVQLPVAHREMAAARHP